MPNQSNIFYGMSLFNDGSTLSIGASRSIIDFNNVTVILEILLEAFVFPISNSSKATLKTSKIFSTADNEVNRRYGYQCTDKFTNNNKNCGNRTYASHEIKYSLYFLNITYNLF